MLLFSETLEEVKNRIICNSEIMKLMNLTLLIYLTKMRMIYIRLDFISL